MYLLEQHYSSYEFVCYKKMYEYDSPQSLSRKRLREPECAVSHGLYRKWNCIVAVNIRTPTMLKSGCQKGTYRSQLLIAGYPSKKRRQTRLPRLWLVLSLQHVRQLRAKCSPVCPFESENCCMAWLLSKQDDFVNQPSMLETLIHTSGHKCIFLPKFHCELNSMEMVCTFNYIYVSRQAELLFDLVLGMVQVSLPRRG